MSKLDVNGETDEHLSGQDEPSSEDVDPRIKDELERLNTATESINKLERELDLARANFRLILQESTTRCEQLGRKLGTTVEKARPYYEARMRAKQLQTQTQKAALRYERASSAHSAAKEMVYLAEEGLKKEGKCFDPAWQEMLNHATLRVNEAETERIESQRQHQRTSSSYNEAEKVVQNLHQDMKKAIVKSRPYFEMKAQFNQLLEEQRKRVHHLEENILKMKMNYADALHNLEEISDEIHKKRDSKTSHNSMDDIHLGERYSDSLSCDSVNSYQNSECNTLSNNTYAENTDFEDNYMSLPSKITNPEIIAISCKRRISQDTYADSKDIKDSHLRLPPKITNPEIIAISCKGNVSQHVSSSELESAVDKLESQLSNGVKTHGIISKKNLCDTSNKHDQHFSKSVLNGVQDDEEKSNGIQGNTFESEEIPECKIFLPDFNLLRIQREELSDTESLASTDTIDTLDDNQIECLLLEEKNKSFLEAQECQDDKLLGFEK